MNAVAKNLAMTRARNDKGVFLPIHGMRSTKLYRVWCAMKERCCNTNNKRYSRYGGRGITVCKEWASSFEAFASWAVQSGYEDGLTIDRIDNNEGYSPDNCRWATRREQNRNYSRNHMLTFNGKTQCIADWADETGLSTSTILYRVKAGKNIEDVLNTDDGRVLRWKRTISANCMQ